MLDNWPTLHADVNALLDQLLTGMQAVLGGHIIGVYLDGSLATGDFDQDSDIDFVAVTGEEVTEDLFGALLAMHDRLAMLDSPWAIQLEGSYISAPALRRYDPALDVHPNIERGRGERLKWVAHSPTWNVHRHVLRKQGIVLRGPRPDTLVDEVSPDDLRRTALATLTGWAASLLADPARLAPRGYQSYVVLSLCRILYTLQTGDVASKLAAARWAQEHLRQPWAALIERAWIGRHEPGGRAEPDDVEATLAFIRYALERGRQAS